MIDLKTLSEMPSVKEMMQRLKNPRRVSTTVTAVGSPLTDPEGVKKGHYSYSETGGIPDGMTQEEYDKAMKEFMEFSEMTPEQIEEMLDTMSKTTSPIKESNPMTRREELETKGVSQLMAERFAKGVPRGAYSECSFEKGGEPLSPHVSKDKFLDESPESAAIRAYRSKKEAQKKDENRDEWGKNILDKNDGVLNNDKVKYNRAQYMPMNEIGANKPREKIEGAYFKDDGIYRKYGDDYDFEYEESPVLIDDATEDGSPVSPVGLQERALSAIENGGKVDLIEGLVGPYANAVKEGKMAIDDAYHYLMRDLEEFDNGRTNIFSSAENFAKYLRPLLQKNGIYNV